MSNCRHGPECWLRIAVEQVLVIPKISRTSEPEKLNGHFFRMVIVPKETASDTTSPRISVCTCKVPKTDKPDGSYLSILAEVWRYQLRALGKTLIQWDDRKHVRLLVNRLYPWGGSAGRKWATGRPHNGWSPVLRCDQHSGFGQPN